MNNCRGGKRSVEACLRQKVDEKCVGFFLFLTPGAVNLLTTKGPRWKSHNLKKMLNAGPEKEEKEKNE